MQPSVYLSLPTSHGTLLKETARAAFVRTGFPGRVLTGEKTYPGSLLAQNFNRDWGTALKLADDGECTHFAMLHDDVLPEPGWLGKLFEIAERERAEVVSAVVAIKDFSGDSSTAVCWPDDPWGAVRLPLKTIAGLPSKTFSIDDCGERGQVLLVNSGCLLVDLRSGWARAADELGRLKAHFTIHDRVWRDADGNYHADVLPEDWNFSRMAAAAGCRVLATGEIFVRHLGQVEFVNRPMRPAPDHALADH